MDGYLSKPAPMDVFRSILEEWIPTAPTNTLIQEEGKNAATIVYGKEDMVISILDTSILAKLVGNDPTMIAEFLADYLGSLNESANVIQTAFNEGDWKLVGAFAHRLKSSSRTVGAILLGECCEQLEQEGKHGDGEAVTARMPQFKRLLASTLDVITKREKA